MNKIRALFLPGEAKNSYADAGDFLRVCSVGLVAWFHIWQQSWLNPNLYIGNTMVNFYPLVACGYMFVDLMLLLSGFLLMLGYLSGRIGSWKDFYTARAARIMPSYYLCIAVMLFVFALPGGLYGSGKHMWTDILSHLTFTHNFFYESYIGTRLNGALWTLAVEMQFYLAFPLIAKVFKKRPVSSWLVMTLLSWLLRMYLSYQTRDISIYFNRLGAMLDVYANGMLAAWIYVKLADREQKAWQAWLNTALTIGAAMAICHVVRYQFYNLRSNNQFGQMLLRSPLTLAGSVFLVCGSRSVVLLRKLLSNRPVRFLSGLTFNFYIWHQFLAVKLKEWRIPFYEGENPNQAGLMPWQARYTAVCFLGALALSLAITYLIEKPCGRWIKRRFAGK